MRKIALLLSFFAALLITGCRTWLIDRTDRDVYRLIDTRQRGALGSTSDTHIGSKAGRLGVDGRMYSLNPHPVDPGTPEAFRRPRQDTEPPGEDVDEAPAGDAEPADDGETSAETEMTPSIFDEDQLDRVRVFSLSDALAYAMRHARDLQDAKEDLYLAALGLSLERHLWTPQFTAGVQAEYQDFGDTTDLDRAMSTVSEAAVTQRLPLGGELSARIIHTLVRDVSDHVSKGESGQMILAGQIPLLRGAGRVAYESRYAAERELIYAVRRYERFRRSFMVELAAEYFSLQGARAAIANTFVSYQNYQQDWERAEFRDRVGRSRTVFDALRAKSNLRQAEADLVRAKARYESALDRFKILIGMPVDAWLDVVEQDKDEESKALDALLPEIDRETAVQVAVQYRLDLLNSADRVDDTRRGVVIAKNRILPDLDLTGSATVDSDPSQLRPLTYRRERTTWQGGIQLRVDDRKAERNAYRSALVSLRRAERNHELSVDTVRTDVREALRQIAQQEDLRKIQELNVQENEFFAEAARAQFRLGKSTNRDVVDAENDLLSARNQFAAAVAAYRVAILDFRRDTGTLRVTDDGRWETPDALDNARGPGQGPGG
ncbi:MAG: TolC family protein [Phycisphaerales bacterium]|nr:MAG: TolC family protein [Phycisphaerales bacterium]